MATINDFARMCNANESCKTCLIKAEMKKLYILECQGYIRRYPTEASDIIDKWCAEHPQYIYGIFYSDNKKVLLCHLSDEDEG